MTGTLIWRVWVNVISRKTLVNFWRRHPDAKTQLQTWYAELEKNSYSALPELKARFPSVDYVKNNRYVFNIKSKKYRLIVQINFQGQVVRIRFIGTHAEYDKVDAATI